MRQSVRPLTSISQHRQSQQPSSIIYENQSQTSQRASTALNLSHLTQFPQTKIPTTPATTTTTTVANLTTGETTPTPKTAAATGTKSFDLTLTSPTKQTIKLTIPPAITRVQFIKNSSTATQSSPPKTRYSSLHFNPNTTTSSTFNKVNTPSNNFSSDKNYIPSKVIPRAYDDNTEALYESATTITSANYLRNTSGTFHTRIPKKKSSQTSLILRFSRINQLHDTHQADSLCSSSVIQTEGSCHNQSQMSATAYSRHSTTTTTTQQYLSQTAESAKSLLLCHRNYIIQVTNKTAKKSPQIPEIVVQRQSEQSTRWDSRSACSNNIIANNNNSQNSSNSHQPPPPPPSSTMTTTYEKFVEQPTTLNVAADSPEIDFHNLQQMRVTYSHPTSNHKRIQNDNSYLNIQPFPPNLPQQRKKSFRKYSPNKLSQSQKQQPSSIIQPNQTELTGSFSQNWTRPSINNFKYDLDARQIATTTGTSILNTPNLIVNQRVKQRNYRKNPLNSYAEQESIHDQKQEYPHQRVQSPPKTPSEESKKDWIEIKSNVIPCIFSESPLIPHNEQRIKKTNSQLIPHHLLESQADLQQTQVPSQSTETPISNNIHEESGQLIKNYFDDQQEENNYFNDQNTQQKQIIVNQKEEPYQSKASYQFNNSESNNLIEENDNTLSCDSSIIGKDTQINEQSMNKNNLSALKPYQINEGQSIQSSSSFSRKCSRSRSHNNNNYYLNNAIVDFAAPKSEFEQESQIQQHSQFIGNSQNVRVVPVHRFQNPITRPVSSCDSSNLTTNSISTIPTSQFKKKVPLKSKRVQEMISKLKRIDNKSEAQILSQNYDLIMKIQNSQGGQLIIDALAATTTTASAPQTTTAVQLAQSFIPSSTNENDILKNTRGQNVIPYQVISQHTPELACSLKSRNTIRSGKQIREKKHDKFRHINRGFNSEDILENQNGDSPAFFGKFYDA